MPLIKYNNNSLSSITALPASIPTGKLKLISSQTASNSASISFTTGLNSTYKVYRFVFVNIHARTDRVEFEFQASTNGGSSYGVACTNTIVRAAHNESGSGQFGPEYDSQMDSAQSTSYVRLTSAGGGISNDSDHGEGGILTLFNPASTVYVKHFIHDINYYNDDVYSQRGLHAGYFNTTSAINAFNFKMSSGNFDGTIYLYAIDNS